MGDVNTARPGMLDFKGACPAAPSSPPACPAGLLDREANALWSQGAGAKQAAASAASPAAHIFRESSQRVGRGAQPRTHSRAVTR